MIDSDKEFVSTIDSQRSVTATPTTDGKSIVLVLEDPHTVAVVEMTLSQVDELIDGLKNLRVD